MNRSGKDILAAWKGRWQMLILLEIFFYASGPALLVYTLTSKLLLALSVFVGIVGIVLFIRKPWLLTLKKVSAFIDKQLESAQFSTGLLLLPEQKLSGLAHLQRHRVEKIVQDNSRRIQPDVPIKRAALVFFLFAGLALWAYASGWTVTSYPDGASETEHPILFKPLDSTSLENKPPVLESQRLTIRYPSFTNKSDISTSDMNIRALEGSRLFWTLKFDRVVDSIILETSTEDHPMKSNGDGYSQNIILNESGFYNFRFTDSTGASYQSDIYSMEMTQDQAPIVEIQQLEQFISFDVDQPKILDFEASVTDDYGIDETYIIATVSKGEGESVKFREERLAFDSQVDKGNKNQQLKKKLDLDSLAMEPGDELYFYVAALDTKHPEPNMARSETYFAVISDTVSDRFAVESTMGADLMPAYFRSQRQLIIDTEKLITNRPTMKQEEFNQASNKLGADQKVLRLKYGQFMGDEAESGIQGGGGISMEGSEHKSSDPEHDMEDSEHQGEGSDHEENPLAEYTHNHDSGNEHNLVEHQHEEGKPGAEEEDPLENYLHNHDNPEESTLFTQSLRSKLRQALNEMWDAELHLRLNEPKKSLPYQYKALKQIQDIKNSARIYVHRIGFDPPPIKEDKRLTGEIDEVTNFRTQDDVEKPEVFPHMRESVERLEQLIVKRTGRMANSTDAEQKPATANQRASDADRDLTSSNREIADADRELFARAGDELASLAIESPGKYLSTLQQLKWLSDSKEPSSLQILEEVQKGLLEAIPEPKPDPTQSTGNISEIDALFLQELDARSTKSQ
ncbi:MAG: tryptophan-rich sensory protein [Pricia sp.]